MAERHVLPSDVSLTLAEGGGALGSARLERVRRRKRARHPGESTVILQKLEQLERDRRRRGH